MRHDARRLSLSGKEDLRRRVVSAVFDEKMSLSRAAEVFNVSRTSVHNWCDLYEEGGEAELTPKRPGRPSGEGQLKGWQAASIVRTITDRHPEQLKLPFALWTREAVGDLIERRYGIRYCRTMVGRLLRRWGFTPQKPVKRAYERDEEAVRRWMEREYPALRDRAKREGAEIYWEDETGLRSDHSVGRGYSPRGRTPTEAGTGKRFGCNIASAVNNKGTMRFMVFRGGFNQHWMIEFLKRLVKDARRKVIVIADGHPSHKGAALREWLEGQEGWCELVYLPGYAPDINPTEVLNQDVKSNVFSVRRPHTKEELLAQTNSYLRSTQRRPDVVRGFFEEQHVNYAAE